ncbi:CvpA family protein [Symbiobacterium thermophilum]|uniref:Colicin V production protein n=1 Tax=Symbiobacterium thermophilum (strain DSM 24528 / JCM 14929 / IAM 14863 / T) TaxID=292459 RepID=Q67J46_SYMTH|nr:CvpA family protein [Symbiobacterium thermophilum]BAD42304.1 hypothetical protein STH3323 [Symbiobacterium thermophilum IAM 14863]
MDLSAMSPLDWVVVVILLLAVGAGWVRGIVRVLLGFLSFLAAVMIAGRATGPVVAWLDGMWNLTGRIADGILDRSVDAGGALSASLDQVAIPQPYKAALVQDVARATAESGEASALELAAQQIAEGAATAVCFVLLVILLAAALRWLGSLFADVVQSLPIVGLSDRLLGAAALGAAAVLALNLVLVWVMPTLSVFGLRGLGELVSQSVTPPYLIQAFEWMRRLVIGGGLRLWNG